MNIIFSSFGNDSLALIQWAIDNKEKYGINILTSSLGEKQFEIHVDNDGSSAWSRQMDATEKTPLFAFGLLLKHITFTPCCFQIKD